MFSYLQNLRVPIKNYLAGTEDLLSTPSQKKEVETTYGDSFLYPIRMNFATKKTNVLQLTSSKVITSGKPIQFREINNSSSSIVIEDDYKLRVTDNGLFQISGRFCVDFIYDSIGSHTISIDVNYKSIALIFSSRSDTSQTIPIHEIVPLKKDDIITITMGSANLSYDETLAIPLNKLSILKL